MHTHYVEHIRSNPWDQDKWDKWEGLNHICCSSALPKNLQTTKLHHQRNWYVLKIQPGSLFLWLVFLHLFLLRSSVHFQRRWNVIENYIHPSPVHMHCYTLCKHLCCMILSFQRETEVSLTRFIDLISCNINTWKHPIIMLVKWVILHNELFRSRQIKSVSLMLLLLLL